MEQYLSYLPFAYEAGMVERGSDSAQKLEAQQTACLTNLNAEGGKDHVDSGVCERILQDMLLLTKSEEDGKMMCYNMYDVRLKDTWPSCGMNWPPDLTNVTPYLRRKEVIAALNIGDSQQPGWTECSGAVGGAFSSRNSKPSIQFLPDLIAEFPLVLFSGAQDLICNHLGTEELINNMEWNGGKGFEISPGNWAPRREWTFEGESAGIYQEARNLTYILFYNSSHMVPFDYARRTRDMLDRFMNVDIAEIGGTPSDSRIDGEKGLETSVGGHPNSTTAIEAEQEKIEAAKWHAYYESGEVVLVIVIILATAWAYYVWRDRRRRAGHADGYTGIFRNSSDGPMSGLGLESLRNKSVPRDVEAADFDEAELDELHLRGPQGGEPRYSIGSASDEDDVADRHAHSSNAKVAD